MKAIVFANGEIEDLAGAKALIEDDDLLIAADGGARFCKAMGLTPQVLIGDLDSLTKEEVETFQKEGSQILRFDPNKDETDLELALLHAQTLGINEVLILGGLGRRWDHSLANLLLPGHQALENLQISYWSKGQWFFLIKDKLEIEASPGTILSLIPVGGDAVGVSCQGLEWALENETLKFGATRGVSNLFATDQVIIEIKKGMLLCIVGSHD